MNRIALGLAACSALLLTVSCSTAAPSPTAPAATASPTTAFVPAQALATPAPPPAATATALPTITASPAPTKTPTTPPTNTSVPTNTPQPAATNTPAPAASIKPATLNVRSGPGSNYDILTAVKQGENVVVGGQTGNCAWLKITTADGKAGWVIGESEYVTLNLPCASVPAAAAPPSPTPAPASPTPVPPPAPTAAGPGLPSDKGCYLFKNYIGDELTVTFTRQGGEPFAFTFRLAPMGEYIKCLDPGRYTYTIDHPKWSGGGELTVVAGKHYRFPIVGRP